MSTSRKPGLPVDLISGLYRPEFEPQIDNIIDPVIDPNRIAEEAEKAVADKIEKAQKTLREGAQKPLTEQQAAEVDRKIDELQGELKATRERIGRFREFIDTQAVGAGGGEVAFEISLKGKPELRRAVIQLFGRPLNKITYSMYLEARKMKQRIEKQEADDYVKGNW